MRILVLQESDWIERGPHQSHHLFERLRQRGHQIRVIDFEIGWRDRRRTAIFAPRKELSAPHKVVPGSEIEIVRPATIHLPVIDYAVSFVTNTIEIRRQLREFRPDIVLGLGLLNAFSGIPLTRRAEIPFVYYLIDELHSLVPQRAFQGLARVVEQSNLRRACAVLCINQALRDYTEAMGASRERTEVLPAGVDLDRYLAAGDGSEVRRLLRIESSDLVMLFMGWVYPFSGLREVARGLIAGVGQEARTTLIVVGKGDGWVELSRIAEESGAQEKIKMVDFRPFSEMPSYLAAADVCLLPAHKVQTMQNIVPIKVYEYLAAGKPVIATRLPGLVKEFGEGHGVVYVDGPKHVLPKLLELAEQGVLQQLGKQGRAFVSRNNWETITDTFEAYLEGLVDRRKHLP